MVATAQAGAVGSYPVAADTGDGGGGSVPFLLGSNYYMEKFGTPVNFQLTTTAQEFVQNINPGGFLRGVRLQVRSAGGVGGTATADNPWNVFDSITLENIDGSPIQYSMKGYSYYIGNMYSRPWDGDPARRYDYAAGQNPSFSLFIKPELKQTAAVLANTDARALYRIKYTLNTWANVIGSGTTAPTVTVTHYLETWAQPDQDSLQGQNIEGIPPGLALASLRRHQTVTLNGAGADNNFQATNTGNEIRNMIMIVRDSNNVRQDYIGDPVRWRLDNKSLGVLSPDEIFNQMSDFYEFLQNGTSQRQTGVYVFPRFFDVGRMIGQPWLGTTNATYLIWEFATLGSAVNVPGTVELITDEVVPVGPVPGEFESI